MTASVTLPTTAWPVERSAEDTALDRSEELDRFLAGVEKRALRIAQIGIGDVDEAMDIVQDAMFRLARRYLARPAEEWRPLFYRILRNRIHDAQRRRSVRARVFGWWPRRTDDGEEFHDPSAQAADPAPHPGRRLELDAAMQTLEAALRALPRRQQQAFMLRNFEGMNVAQTAAAMSCSQGSVKTHYSRAVHALRAQLGDHWS